MKKLFTVLCDIMAVSTVLAIGSLIIWAAMALLGIRGADLAETVFIVSAAVVVIDTGLSYIVWNSTEEDDE